MSVRPLVDRQYLGQLAVVREPTGSVGRHRSVNWTVTVTAQYLALAVAELSKYYGRRSERKPHTGCLPRPGRGACPDVP